MTTIGQGSASVMTLWEGARTSSQYGGTGGTTAGNFVANGSGSGGVASSTTVNTTGGGTAKGSVRSGRRLLLSAGLRGVGVHLHEPGGPRSSQGRGNR